MKRILGNTSHYWRNENLACFVFLILEILLFCSCDRINENKLIGIYNADYESTNWYRSDSNIYLKGDCVIIQEDSIFLPIIGRLSDTVYVSPYDMSDEKYWADSKCQKKSKGIFDLLRKDIIDSHGTYKLIGNKRDSILINVPNHPLNGKYAIRIYQKINLISKTDETTCIILENDSTFFKCYRTPTSTGTNNFVGYEI